MSSWELHEFHLQHSNSLALGFKLGNDKQHVLPTSWGNGIAIPTNVCTSLDGEVVLEHYVECMPLCVCFGAPLKENDFFESLVTN